MIKTIIRKHPQGTLWGCSLVSITVSHHSIIFLNLCKGGENSEKRETQWMLLCIAGGRSAPPKNEVAGIAGIYKQRVVSDS